MVVSTIETIEVTRDRTWSLTDPQSGLVCPPVVSRIPQRPKVFGEHRVEMRPQATHSSLPGHDGQLN